MTEQQMGEKEPTSLIRCRTMTSASVNHHNAQLCPYCTPRLSPEVSKHRYPCPTDGCPGDGRYAAPGRGHIAGCTSPVLPPAPPRIRGFGVTAAELDTSVQRAAHAGWSVADLAGRSEADVERASNGPRLWQDEGDQA